MKKLLSLVLCIAAMATITLFASCIKENETVYTVSFDLNGGICEDATDLECKDGTVVDLTKYVPTREDYLFNGWSLDDVVVTEATVKSDLTFKAQWEYVYDLEEINDGSAYAFKGIKADYSKTELVLPEEYEGKKITTLKAGALDRASGITSLVVCGGYTEIEAGVFTPLTAIESITVPFYGKANDENYFITLFKADIATDDLHYAVTNNENSYLIPTSFKTLEVTGGDIVPDIKKLKLENFTLSSLEITEIDARTFNNNPTIKSIDLSGCKNIVKIGDGNFSECENLKNVNLGGLEKLTVIGAHAFYFYVPGTDEKHVLDIVNLSGLTSLETIGQMSFWYISVAGLDFSQTSINAFGRQNVFHCRIGKIALPATFNPLISEEESSFLEEKYNLTYLNNSEFLGSCEGLAQITVDKLSLYATVDNGALYDADKTVVFKYAGANDAETYVAPETLLKIAPTAFENSTKLKNIDLGTCMVNTIGYNAFDGCNADIKVGFDKYSYYKKDGSKVSLANNWKGDCKVTYGERYLYFAFTETKISDGLDVVNAGFTFDITAKYGDDDATVTVTLNGEIVERATDGYTVTLKTGKNEITAVASFDGKTSETKVYTINLNEEWKIETNFKDGQKMAWAGNDNLVINVTAVNPAGEKQKITSASLKVDCGYSASFVSPFAGINIVYNDDGSATITLDAQTLLMWDYDVTKSHHILIEVNQSENITISKTYDAQYYEDSPEISSETPVSGNVASGNEWNIVVGVKSGNTSFTITDVKIEAATDGAFFENSMILSYELSSDGLSATVKVDLSVFGGWGYVYDGDSFKIRITVTTKEGFTLTQVFNAEYSE